MSNFPTTVNPSYGLTQTSKPRVRIAQFGSGYSQRSTFGINQNLKKYTLQFTNITTTQSEEIKTFLDNLAGVESFSYQIPNESVTRKFICRDWNETIPYPNRATINAIFEEVAEA